MPKASYTPTPADRATGARVRQLRKLAGETQTQTVERSGVSFGFGTLCRIENGARHLSIPDATKLAAHFNTTVEKILIRPEPATPVVTEQAWLGNAKDDAPALFAVPDRPADNVKAEYVIDMSNPLTPDEYREQVWIPYLEHRYQTDQRAS